MDDGIGGGFNTAAGGDSATYLRTFVQFRDFDGSVALDSYDSDTDSFSKEVARGFLYRFRYRAKKINDWGPYSPITSIYVASRAESPQALTLVECTSTYLTVKIEISTDNNGL